MNPSDYVGMGVTSPMDEHMTYEDVWSFEEHGIFCPLAFTLLLRRSSYLVCCDETGSEVVAKTTWMTAALLLAKPVMAESADDGNKVICSPSFKQMI